MIIDRNELNLILTFLRNILSTHLLDKGLTGVTEINVPTLEEFTKEYSWLLNGNGDIEVTTDDLNLFIHIAENNPILFKTSLLYLHKVLTDGSVEFKMNNGSVLADRQTTFFLFLRDALAIIKNSRNEKQKGGLAYLPGSLIATKDPSFSISVDNLFESITLNTIIYTEDMDLLRKLSEANDIIKEFYKYIHYYVSDSIINTDHNSELKIDAFRRLHSTSPIFRNRINTLMRTNPIKDKMCYTQIAGVDITDDFLQNIIVNYYDLSYLQKIHPFVLAYVNTIADKDDVILRKLGPVKDILFYGLALEARDVVSSHSENLFNIVGIAENNISKETSINIDTLMSNKDLINEEILLDMFNTNHSSTVHAMCESSELAEYLYRELKSDKHSHHHDIRLELFVKLHRMSATFRHHVNKLHVNTTVLPSLEPSKDDLDDARLAFVIENPGLVTSPLYDAVKIAFDNKSYKEYCINKLGLFKGTVYYGMILEAYAVLTNPNLHLKNEKENTSMERRQNEQPEQIAIISEPKPIDRGIALLMELNGVSLDLFTNDNLQRLRAAIAIDPLCPQMLLNDQDMKSLTESDSVIKALFNLTTHESMKQQKELLSEKAYNTRLILLNEIISHLSNNSDIFSAKFKKLASENGVNKLDYTINEDLFDRGLGLLLGLKPDNTEFLSNDHLRVIQDIGDTNELKVMVSSRVVAELLYNVGSVKVLARIRGRIPMEVFEERITLLSNILDKFSMNNVFANNYKQYATYREKESLPVCNVTQRELNLDYTEQEFFTYFNIKTLLDDANSGYLDSVLEKMRIELRDCPAGKFAMLLCDDSNEQSYNALVEKANKR